MSISCRNIHKKVSIEKIIDALSVATCQLLLLLLSLSSFSNLRLPTHAHTHTLARTHMLTRTTNAPRSVAQLDPRPFFPLCSPSLLFYQLIVLPRGDYYKLPSHTHTLAHMHLFISYHYYIYHFLSNISDCLGVSRLVVAFCFNMFSLFMPFPPHARPRWLAPLSLYFLAFFVSFFGYFIYWLAINRREIDTGRN